MAFFDKEKLKVISEGEGADLRLANLNQALSAVEFDEEHQFFYVTIDKVLFSNPITTISSVLESQGFVANLENILSCLDSFVFSARAKVTETESSEGSSLKVSEYLPCIKFELPEKNRIGNILQSYYNEITKYQSKNSGSQVLQKNFDTDLKSARSLTKELERLKVENESLREQLKLVNEQLIEEKKASAKALKNKEDQESLPANTKICRVEHVDLKRRTVKVKSLRKIIDVPTHLLDRVPDFKARCLITFDDSEKVPVGVLFFDDQELGSLEKRTADLLYVEGDTFKARDSMRNEFQIKALNEIEQQTISSLSRGMKILVSIVDDYVVRFSVLAEDDAGTYKQEVQEQLVVYDIGKNQLLSVKEVSELSSNGNAAEQDTERK